MRSGSYGEYYRDCFIIKLNVDLDFTNIDNTDTVDQFGTFIHEYFHFLQNIATTFGYMSMAVFYAKMLDILRMLETCVGDTVSKIATYNSSIDSFVVKQEIALGDMDSWTYGAYDYFGIQGVSLNRDETMGEFADCVVPTIEVMLRKSGRIEQRTLNFGASCIMESMADMLEEHIYGITKKDDFVQYDICKKLWEYVFGKKYAKNNLVFRCCEYSLMYDNPGQMFYCALVQLKNSGVNVTEEVIDNFFLKRIYPDYHKIYQDWYLNMMRLLSQVMPKEHAELRALKEYIENFSKYFYELRKNQSLIFTGLFNESPQNTKIKLIDYMGTACPLILNKDNETYVSNSLKAGEHGIEEYAALYALYRLARDRQNKSCILTSYCKINTDCEVNQSCYDAPLQSKNRKKLCLLGQLLYKWKVKADYFEG